MSSGPKYVCHSEGCAVSVEPLGELTAKHFEFSCPSCSGALEPAGPVLSDFERRVIDYYPQMIAWPFAQLHAREDLVHKTQLLAVDVFTNVLKYMALVVESDYLHSDLQLPHLNRIINDELSRPLVSAWVHFLGEALPAFEKADVLPFIRELPDFYRCVQSDMDHDEKYCHRRVHFDQDGEKVETADSLGLLEAMIHFRNRLAHGFRPPVKEAQAAFDTQYAVMLRVLEAMQWCADYPMYKREGGRFYRLMGCESVGADPGVFTVPVEANLLLADSEHERFLSLLPLFIVPSEHIADHEDGLDLLVYDQRTDKRILYISPRGHARDLKGTVNRWRELMEHKQVLAPLMDASSFGAQEMQARCKDRTTRTLEGLRESQNRLSDTYTPRLEVERDLEAWAGSLYPLLLLMSPAGCGKTRLLAEMAERWTVAGHTAVLLRAAQIKRSDLMGELRASLRISDAMSDDEIVAGSTENDRRLLILVDGANEHADRAELLRRIVELCKSQSDTGRFGVLVSLRDDQLDWIDISDEDRALLYQRAPQEQTLGTDTGALPAVRFGLLDMVGVELMWKRYAKAHPSRFRTPFSLLDLQRHSRTLAERLRNPLVLRLFLEVHSNRQMPRSLSETGIFDAYVERLRRQTGDEGALLQSVAAICLERRRAQLDLDDLYDDPRTGHEVRRTDIASAYRILRREGVLTETRDGDATLVGFVVEPVFENCLAEVLLEGDGTNTAESLAAWVDAIDELPVLEGAVAAVLDRRLAQAGLPFVDRFGELSGRRGSSIAGAVFARHVLAASTEADGDATAGLGVERIELVRSAVRYLESNLGLKVARRMLVPFVERVEAASPGSRELAALLADLTRLHTGLCDYQDAVETARRSLEIRQTTSDPDKLDIAHGEKTLGWALLKLGARTQGLLQVMEHQERALLGFTEALGQQHPLVSSCINDIGVTLRALGRYRDAAKRFEEALRGRRAALGDQHPFVATAHENLGMAYGDLGDLRRALEEKKRALEIRRSRYGKEHPEVARSLNSVAWTHGKLGDHKRALELRWHSLRIRRRFFGEDHPDVANCLNDIGVGLRALGRFDESIEQLDKALSIRKKCLGAEHILVAVVVDNLARTHGAAGDRHKELELLQKALDLRIAARGPEHPTVADSLNAIGWTWRVLGDHSKALEYQRRALALGERNLGAEHPNLSSNYHDIGVTLGDLGDHKEALKNKKEAAERRRAQLGEDHPNVAMSLNSIGVTLGRLGDYEGSLKYKRKSLKIYRKVRGPKHTDVAMVMHNIGATLVTLGRTEEAIQHHREGLAIREEFHGADHPKVAVSLSSLAALLCTEGDYAQARALYERVLAIRQRCYPGPKRHPSIATVMGGLGAVAAGEGDVDAALAYHRQALKFRLQAFGTQHTLVARSRDQVGRTLSLLGDHEAALVSLRCSLKVRVEILGPGHLQVARSHESLGDALAKAGRDREALSHLEQAQQIAETVLDPAHKRRLRITKAIADVRQRLARVQESGSS